MHCLSFCLSLLFAIISLITFGIDLYVNYASINGNNKISNITNDHLTQITPVSSIFMVAWNIIYGILILWYLFMFYLLLCRKMVSQIDKMPLFPGIFWFLFIVVNVLNGTWVYLFSNNHMIVSGIILIVLTLILYLITLMAYRICWLDVTSNALDCNNDMENDDDKVLLLKWELVLLRILTLNGIPLYAMWCTIATSIQWSMILRDFILHIGDDASCIVVLSILSTILFFYWLIDICYRRKYGVYTWLTYFILIIAFGGILGRYDGIGGKHRPALFFSFILLVVSGFMTLLKLFSVCLCHSKRDNPNFSRV